VGAAAALPLQDAERIGIHQNGKAVAEEVGIGIDDNGALTFNTSAEDSAETEQRTATANFAGIAAAITDELAVGAQDCFHQGNRIQGRLPFAYFVHTKP